MRSLFRILLVVLAASLSACREQDLSEDFKLDDSIRMEIKGYVIFKYDPYNCQIGFNRDKCEFRVHTDNMSDFFQIRFDDMPAAEGQIVEGTVSWTTGDNLHNKKTTFELVRLEGNKIWLWSPSTRMAAVVEVLE